jgi:hypothetical protein
MAAGESLGLWSQALLGVTMVFSAYTSNGESSTLMKWLIYRTYLRAKEKSRLELLGFFMQWFSSILKKDQLAMGSRFANYFNMNGLMHPMAIYTMGKV